MWIVNFRLAMLDDVRRQIKPGHAKEKSEKGTLPFRRIDGATLNSDNNEYEVGVASGYAIQQPSPSGFVSPQNHASDFDYDNYHRHAIAGSKAGLCFSY